jgi:hypothetical protein
MAAAAGGVGAGLISCLALLAAGRKKPVLLVEGLVFGGVTALGELVAFPGGKLILMELVIGVLFLLSVPLGWDLLERITGGLARGMVPPGGSGILTLTLGGVLVIHGAVYTILSMNGSGGLITGAVLFVLLYVAALRLASTFMKRALKNVLPELTETDDEASVLRRGDSVLGKLRFEPVASGLVRVTWLDMRVPGDAFLPSLEAALKGRGFGSVLITGYEGDCLELEMNGFVHTPAGWRKRL